MSKYTASIIIPVFNQWNYTYSCLLSLQKNTPENIQVIVVDNGSTDKTVEELGNLGSSLWGDSFKAVHLTNNKGFASACNLGSQHALSEILIFLNNDTLLTSGWLWPLINKLYTENNLGAIGPLLLYPNHELVQHSGVTFLPGSKFEHLYEYFPANHPLINKQRSLQTITAAAMCIRKKLFMEQGCFHQGYLNGCEDIDLCIQLRRKGYLLKCETSSWVYHYGSQTEGRFASETQNFTLLQTRQGRYIEPDIHVHAFNDGYAIGLNEWLLPFVCLTDEVNRDLDMTARDKKPEQWMKMLNKEPLWFQGYELLASFLEQKKSFQDALFLRFLAAHFYPCRETYFKLMKTAQKAENKNMTDVTASKLELIVGKINDAKLQAQKMLKWAQEAEDPFWAKLYADWMNPLPKSKA
jgi:GT2 family glycosyltransferase